ncbi:SDR family NAD(P)-dependent oxidoreductase [Actinomadura sp. SCN-SB]|uniref:SDR family NAD(P)-dependent oxidoreductase n=1 Tax=Actinomadura sp. SCN-SB TaxID=3373092 RepID=UPI003751283E
MTLDGRITVVTGGTEGLGLEIARTFAAHGAVVTVTGRSAEKGALAAKEIGGTFVESDATRRKDAEDAIDRTVETFGRVDILVNNVGGSSGFARVHEMTDDAWLHAIDLNLHSAFWTTRRALPAMMTAGFGRIINMSSVEGKQATMPAISHYVTAKHALHGFTRAVALEYGKQGITCNALCPGAVPTQSRPSGDAAAKAAGMTREEFVAHFVDGTKTGRLNTPAEVAAVALLLASEAGAGITGALWSIDGGTASW